MERSAVYDLRDYDIMLADPVRTRAYLDAIAHTVRPGDVVVEIGTGVGYFAVAAARAGARRVYAIEQSAVAEVARAVIADNGCAAVVTVIHDDAMRVSLPERGDVLLEDIRSVLPMHGRRIDVLADARTRHLKADARFVARRDTVWAVPVVAPSPPPNEAAAETLGETPFGIDRRAVASRLRDEWRRVRLGEGDQLAAPALLATIDLETVTLPNVDGAAAWTIAHDGRLEGVAVWFDAELAGGARISNAPAAPRALYGQALFPLTRPVDVHQGDRVRVAWRATLVAGDYVFSWQTRIEPSSVDAVVAYRQSTLASILPSCEAFECSAVDGEPHRGTTHS